MKRIRTLILRALGLVLVAALVAACSPYAGISIGAPFSVGPFVVNPQVGVGSFL